MQVQPPTLYFDEEKENGERHSSLPPRIVFE